VLRFLNNNDTGPRFITTYGVGCYRAAMAMLLTLPGIPCLFTGDEVGAEYEPYKSSGPIDWTDRCRLREDVRRLIGLRRETPSLHSRAWKPLAIAPAGFLFAYLRGDAATGQAIVVINFSPEDTVATLDLSDQLTTGTWARELHDLWSGERFAIPPTGRLEFPLPGHGFRIMARSST
jgi:glycosidase